MIKHDTNTIQQFENQPKPEKTSNCQKTNSRLPYVKNQKVENIY